MHCIGLVISFCYVPVKLDELSELLDSAFGGTSHFSCLTSRIHQPSIVCSSCSLAFCVLLMATCDPARPLQWQLQRTNLLRYTIQYILPITVTCLPAMLALFRCKQWLQTSYRCTDTAIGSKRECALTETWQRTN